MKREIVLGILGIVAVAVVILLLRNFPGLRSFEFGAQRSGLNLKVNAEGRFEIRAFLDSLVADTTRRADWAREDIMSWSRDHLDMVTTSDIALLERLAALCPAADLRDINAYQEHVERCERDTVTRELRRLSLEKDPPFQPLGRTVRIGTPEKPPRAGEAYTCYDSDLENRRLQVSVYGGPQAIEVIARGAYVCSETGRFPDLQIAPSDAEALYGRPTRQYETAVALVN